MPERLHLVSPEELIDPTEHNRDDAESFFNPESQYAQEYAERWVEMARRQVIIGQGNRAEVYNSIPKNPEREEEGDICMKVNVREPERDLPLNSLRQEMAVHSEAYILLNAEKELPVARVPKPICLIDGTYFAMEQVKNAKTVFRLMLETVTEKNNITVESNETDRQVLAKVLPRLSIKKDERRKDENEAIYQAIVKECQGHALITREQFEKMKNTIDVLNRHGLFHRDVTSRNTMIDQDGEPYIIDFGTAIFQRNLTEEQAFAVHLDDGTVAQLRSDSSHLNDLLPITQGYQESVAQQVVSRREQFLERYLEKNPDLAKKMSVAEQESLQNGKNMLELFSDDGFKEWFNREVTESRFEAIGAVFSRFIQEGTTPEDVSGFISQQLDKTLIQGRLERKPDFLARKTRVKDQVAHAIGLTIDR